MGKLKPFKIALLVLLLLGLIDVAFAQNTKGDKPARPLPRLTQKSKPQKSRKVKSTTRDISGRRLRTKNKSTAARAIISASSPYAGRPSRVGDRPARPIKGSSTRVRSNSAQLARNNVYPNKGPYINNPSRKPRKSERSFPNARPIGSPLLLGRSRAASIPKKSRVAPLSRSRSFISPGRKNVYWGKFSKGEKAYTKDITGRPLRTKNFRTPSPGVIPQPNTFYGRGTKGDKPYNGNDYSGFLSATKRGQRAWQGDISKHAIGKNSSKARIESAGEQLYPRKLSISGRAKRGKRLRGSGFQSRSGKGLSNRKLAAKIPAGGAGVANYRGLKGYGRRPFTAQGAGFSGYGKARRPLKGGGSITGRISGNALPVRLPPSSAARAGAFSGFTKSQKPFKGGGSISGRSRNNQGNAIAVRVPASGAAGVGTYSGNLKFSKPLKGGGSISGRSRNNNGNAIAVRLPSSAAAKGGTYSGNLKFSKPLKGGGSISGRSRNNKGNAIAVRLPSSGAARAGTYSGNLKFSKPLKGGGSVSGRSRNNKGNAIAVRIPSSGAARAGAYSGNLKGSSVFNYRDQGEEFTGFLKASKPLRGGGSISGRSRNNKGNAIAVRIPTSAAARAGTYSGNIKAYSVFNYRDQGEEFTGFIKAKKPVKGGGSVSGKLWNNDNKPIDVRTPLSRDAKAANYAGKIKRKFDYTQNEKSAKESIKKKEPLKGVFAVNDLQIKIKQGNYKKNPKSKELALKGIAPNSSTVKASEYVGKMKMYWDYKHNPSSNKLALNVVRPNLAFTKGNDFQGRIRLTRDYRHNPKSNKDALRSLAPSKAYAKIGNFQGNLKMSKPHGNNLHPDAKFAHGHVNNVKGERTILTNVKLWWSKLLKKGDTQPNAVKEKVRRPRYDKKEQQLWKDLYD